MSQATKDAIRAAVFNQQIQSRIVPFAGVEIELRQPPVGLVISRNSEDRKELMARMLTDYCFVPGTNERVFDEADTEALMAMPFNSDYTKLQQAINELTDFGTAAKEEAKN